MEARGDTDVQIVRYALRKGRKTNRTIQLFVSLRTAEDEQLHQVKRMIRGIGHPILKLEICKIQFFTFSEPLGPRDSLMWANFGKQN